MLLCGKVAFSTKNLQLKQFNGNFDTCICLVHLLPLYTSEMSVRILRKKMKWQIDMTGSFHIGYCCSYIYGQILVVHPSECNQLSCSYTFQHGNRTKNSKT